MNRAQAMIAGGSPPTFAMNPMGPGFEGRGPTESQAQDQSGPQ